MNNPWAGHWHSHPAGYWHALRRRRGGSRLLWFVFGAGAATFWIKSHEAHEWRSRCWRDRIPQDAYPVPQALPPAYANSSAATAQPEEHTGEKECKKRRGWGWSSREGYKSWPSPPPAQEAQAQAAATPAPAPAPHVLPAPMPTDRWEEERHRVQQLSKQATDTISELSEATLDSVLTTVQTLKVKLAEARKEREQHLQQMQSIKDEQYKMFEEWRRQHEKQQQEQPQAQQQPPKPRYPVDFTAA
ncbi:hypothetical protein DAEQUDRAFT_759225 [Daedalea quercina L-15889]|uniref:Uncharacterized protein n=1 Tax=Daedalea quercina L-15889 TaxID=1314783 RepID=A0A165MFK9_9APHY|nr:hypothetical protein DAEQUDRAFT_759225 [Daedalea quercina L-15889]